MLLPHNVEVQDDQFKHTVPFKEQRTRTRKLYTGSYDIEMIYYMILVLFIIGLTLLIIGAEILLNGTINLSFSLGFSPIILSVIVLISPDLTVSVQAGLQQRYDLILGNVIGGNVFNILFVIGMCALISPLHVSSRLKRLDVPLMIGLVLVLVWMAMTGFIRQWFGGLLCAGFIVYTLLSIRQSQPHPLQIDVTHEHGQSRIFRSRYIYTGSIILGLLMMILGSRLLIQSTASLAAWLGVSDLVIGLTIVAIGTALPQAAASILATLRGRRDIALGNAVGSSILHLLVLPGFTSLITSGGIPVAASIVRFDLPLLVLIVIGCLPIFFNGTHISQREGFVLLGMYAVYMLYLVLDATRHPGLPLFKTITVAFIIPGTLAMLWYPLLYGKSRPRVR